MSTAKRVIEGKKTAGSRSRSATGVRNLMTNNKSTTALNGEAMSKTPMSLRTNGPVTRSLAAARSAFSTKMTNITTKSNGTKTQTTTKLANGHLPPPVPSTTTKSTKTPATDGRASRPLGSSLNKLAARLTPLRAKSKPAKNPVTTSKDSVISGELLDSGDIQWVSGAQYEFFKDRASYCPKQQQVAGNDKDDNGKHGISYLHLSQVLSGYGNAMRRSKTPDANHITRVKTVIELNNAKKDVTSQTAISNPIGANLPTDRGITPSQSGSEVSDNGFCDGRNNDLDECSSYSFVVPLFEEPIIDGAGYRRLVDGITSLFQSHLKKCGILLENEADLLESISENVRVAVGRTQLLMKKRLAQFNNQLQRHLNPIDGEKVTTLNDLHGLWSLVNIQLDDIRSCFEILEVSRRSDWQAAPSPKKTLAAASSMPSLRIIQPTATATKPANGDDDEGKTDTKKGAKSVYKTTSTTVAASSKENENHARSVAMTKKRQDEVRKRHEFLRAKRAEMAAATASANCN